MLLFKKGPKREKQIYLYLHENHFDIITSVSAFLGKGYWCLDCKEGFNNKKIIDVTKSASAVS